METTFETTIYLDDVPFGVKANFYPGEPMVMYYPDGSGYPGSPDDVECESISFGGVEFTPEQEELFIKSYGEKEFDEWLLEEAYDHFQSEAEAYADWQYEQWKDRRYA